MTTYTKAQLDRLLHAADMAYDRISKQLEHDPDLAKAEMEGFGDYVSRAQGALLDLRSAIWRRKNTEQE